VAAAAGSGAHPAGERSAGDRSADGAAPAAAVPSAGGVVVPPPDPSLPPPKRVLVVGDENLLFTTGLQEAYPDIEFTVTTVLSRSNLEAYNFDPHPQVLRGRIRHMVDPCRIGKHFQGAGFDDIMLFLPGLGFATPRELGSSDRPLFAYRCHLFAFHVIRHSKLLLKGEGHLHLVWPDENRFMTSPCGAAGIEMGQLVQFCGCKPVEAQFEMEKIHADHFFPFILGDVPTELPEWMSGPRIHSFTLDRSPIAIPLSVALLLHPDVGFVSIKDASPDAPVSPMPGAPLPLRMALVHEANTRKERLKEIYAPKENVDEKPDVLGLVPEPPEEDSLLSIPMEIFMISFDDLPHLSMVLKFLICEEQPPPSVASLDVLDPRLPTRISRPPPAKPTAPNPLSALVNSVMQGKKRQRSHEEWGMMKFYCPLTKICTPTAEKMRDHIRGDLYRRMAAAAAGWDDSTEKKDLILDLEEEEASERSKRARIGQSDSGGKGGQDRKGGRDGDKGRKGGDRKGGNGGKGDRDKGKGGDRKGGKGGKGKDRDRG